MESRRRLPLINKCGYWKPVIETIKTTFPPLGNHDSFENYKKHKQNKMEPTEEIFFRSK